MKTPIDNLGNLESTQNRPLLFFSSHLFPLCCLFSKKKNENKTKSQSKSIPYKVVSTYYEHDEPCPNDRQCRQYFDKFPDLYISQHDQKVFVTFQCCNLPSYRSGAPIFCLYSPSDFRNSLSRIWVCLKIQGLWISICLPPLLLAMFVLCYALAPTLDFNSWFCLFTWFCEVSVIKKKNKREQISVTILTGVEYEWIGFCWEIGVKKYMYITKNIKNIFHY